MLCDAVMNEVATGRTAPLLELSHVLAHHRNHDALNVDAMATRFPYLGPGEINVLAWAVHLKKLGRPYRCVLDDKRARRAADALQVQKTGTIGLLRFLEEHEILSKDERLEVEAILKRTGFYYSE